MLSVCNDDNKFYSMRQERQRERNESNAMEQVMGLIARIYNGTCCYDKGSRLRAVFYLWPLRSIEWPYRRNLALPSEIPTSGRIGLLPRYIHYILVPRIDFPWLRGITYYEPGTLLPRNNSDRQLADRPFELGLTSVPRHSGRLSASML